MSTAVAHRNKQSGAAMLMSLALMLVLGTLSFSMLQAVGLEQRLADQERDRQVAFHAAEAALRQAQSLIEDNELGLFSPLRDANFPSICTKGLCRGSPAKPAWKTLSALDWADGATPTREYPAPLDALDLKGLAASPRYLLEYQGNLAPLEPGAPCVALFLITARATGLSPHAVATLQSEYRLRAGTCQQAI